MQAGIAMEAGSGNFDEVFNSAMRERGAGGFVEAPSGLEQRLLARLAQEEHTPVAAPQPFMFAESIRTQRSATSLWFALGAHAAAILLIGVLVAQHVQIVRPKVEQALVNITAPPPLRPPVLPKASQMGGGGGQHDLAPVTQGHLPKFAQQQIVPPKAPPTIPPKLAVEPTVVVQPDIKMASNTMPNIGLPSSSLKGISLGNGSGTGVGSGNGSGMGLGSGSNTGGGVMHIGGGIKEPVVIHEVYPEFSEEARKAKFSGNVEVYLYVDEQGNPSHVRIARGVGMGLDEKAIEAVRQYKFKPATKDGKPVKVDLYVEVNFQIF